MFLVPIPTLKENGGGAVVMAFARRLAASGERVVIISSGFHGDAPTRDPQNAGLGFIVAPAIGGGPLGAMIVLFARAFWVSLRQRPRLIYSHVATTLIPDFSGQRPFMLAQDVEYRFFEGLPRALVKRVFARGIGRARLLVTSLWLAKYFRRRHCDIAWAGDVGLSRQMFVDAPVTSTTVRLFDFLLIAKRGAHKRRDEALVIARALAQRGHVVRLIDQAADEQTPDGHPGLTVTGAVTAQAMRDLYQQTRVFIGVSRAEGYGLTPLEALSQGCRVVTTPTPSTTNLSHDCLSVLAGSETLVDRLVAAAEAQLAASARPQVTDGANAIVHSLPFMEDWSAAACRAIAGASLS